MLSLQQSARRLAAHVPSALAAPGAVARIETIADAFPAAITDCLCFEVGLTTPAAEVDFSFICKQQSPGAEILAGRSKIGLREAVAASPAWTTVRRFCSEWLTPGSPIHDRVNDIWLEFDVARQQGGPIPCIIVSAGIGREQPAGVEWLVPVLDVLEIPHAHHVLEHLRRFRPRAMANGFHFGVTCSASATARLVFYGVTPDIVSALDDMGVAGASDVAPLAQELRDLTDIISLGINLGGSIGPRLALECKFAETRRIDRPRWDRLMDHLVARGWCSPVCRDALFEWPGASVERLSHRVLPATVFRKISHFEVLLEPGTPPEARAYLFSVVT